VTTSQPLEPGLLRVFRLFAILQAVLTGAEVARLAHIAIAHGMPPAAVVPADAFALCGFGGTLVLVVYLGWPWVQHVMGARFMPVGVVLAAATALAAAHLEFVVNYRMEGFDPSAAVELWEAALMLLAPLVVLAWQYRFRIVVGYCLLTGILDWGVKVLVLGRLSPDLEVVESFLMLRSLLYLAVGYMLVQLMVAQREQRQALARANARLADYATALEDLATTRERNRLARELHDTLAHTLSGLAVQLEAVLALWHADPDRSHALLQRSLDATRQGLAETRGAIQSLRAGPLEDLGLGLAVRDLAEAAAGRAGFALTLNVLPDPGRLAPSVEQCVFRVAQEALENAVRHSGARQVTVQLERAARDLILTIADDGCGFAYNAQPPLPSPAAGEERPANARPVPGSRREEREPGKWGDVHFGLSGMRERAELAAGRLEVSSAPGQGTRVRLVIEATESDDD